MTELVVRISDHLPNPLTLTGLALLGALWLIRQANLQARRTGAAVIALAQTIGTPEALEAALLLFPEKKRKEVAAVILREAQGGSRD